MIEHAEDGFFVSRDNARRENYRVVLVDRDEAVIIHGDAREGRHWLRLRAGSENDDFARFETANVLRANDHAVRNVETFEVVGDFDVVHHAASDESNFAADAARDVNDLLNSCDGGCEAGKDDAARGGAAEFFEAPDDGAFGWRVARTLDVGGIGKKCEYALVAVFGERRNVEAGTVDGRVINFEVAGMNDDAEGRANSKRDAVDGAVRDRDEFDFVGTDFHTTARNDFAERCGVEQASFFQAFFYECERETLAEEGNI